MPKSAQWLIGASFAAASTLWAPDATAQFYLGAQGGWTGLEGTTSSVTGINPAGAAVTFPIRGSFDSGYNVGARLGFQMREWRFEGEYSHRENTGNSTSLGTALTSDFGTDSFMANVIYDFTLGWGPFTPHIGFGIGGADATGTIKTAAFGTLSKASEFVFAYQAIAGVRYLIGPQFALDLDYRYRGMDSVSYTTSPFTFAGATFPSRTFKGNGNTNNFVASVTYLLGAAPPPPPPYIAPPPPPLPIPRGEKG